MEKGNLVLLSPPKKAKKRPIAAGSSKWSWCCWSRMRHLMCSARMRGRAAAAAAAAAAALPVFDGGMGGACMLLRRRGGWSSPFVVAFEGSYPEIQLTQQASSVSSSSSSMQQQMVDSWRRLPLLQRRPSPLVCSNAQFLQPLERQPSCQHAVSAPWPPSTTSLRHPSYAAATLKPTLVRQVTTSRSCSKSPLLATTGGIGGRGKRSFLFSLNCVGCNVSKASFLRALNGDSDLYPFVIGICLTKRIGTGTKRIG
jgi:hypothetical protein